MALIVEYHVVADMYPVSGNVTAGMLVALNTAGQAVAAPTSTSPMGLALGIAGDSALAAEGQTTAYSAQVRLGADGGTQRYTANRVSDFYNETAASLKITVYNGGGKFWVSTDLFDAPAGITPGIFLGVSSGTAGEWEDDTSATVRDDDICAVSVGSAQGYPSGVPGTDIDGHITLGDYIPVVLRI